MTRVFLAFAMLLGANAAFAQCSFDVEVGDTLAYNVDAINVGADCAEVTINLKHTGNLPAAAMGHNWVLTKTGDLDAVATAGMSTGLAGNYLPADDARVLAASKIIGGGESTTLTFSTEGLSAGEAYSFFCSFPGHWSVMKGTFSIG
ncbi:MAG: azurin [Pseudomonadota bacterium]